MVDVPGCLRRNGTRAEPVFTMFNQAFQQGGSACAVRTVEKLTGIRMDHHIVVDFRGFKEMVEAVDGVEVCLREPIDDKAAELKLPAGRVTQPDEHGPSCAREAGTEALTVDSQLDSINKLKDLGLELGKLNVKNLAFITLPVKDNPAETVKATVVVDESQAPEIFDLLKNDVSFTEVKQQEKKEKAAVAARLKGTKAPASEVRVQVFNGGAPDGSAQEMLRWLQIDEGVSKSENAGNADGTLKKTTLEYAPDQADQARRLADILGMSGSGMKPGESVTNTQGLPAMTLTLGEDFKGAGVSLTPPSKASDDIKKSTSTADKVECAQ
ncbi:LCP family protein [Streptomyces hirsutus]